MTTRSVIGCMTGTSLDGLDAALLTISGQGLAITARFERAVSLPLGPCATPLRHLAEQHPMTAGEIAALSRDFALLHARACQQLLAGRSCDLICVHGQTVFHQPPLSWQLFQPAPLAAALRCPVLCDLRQADLALGGQGAPITPIADYILFRASSPRTIINLGGFCNVTALPAHDPAADHTRAVASIQAADLCACNQLLDAIARRRLHQPYDDNGAAASSGSLHLSAVHPLRAHLRTQRAARRSLGTGDELAALLASFDHLAPPDLLRSACEALADVILDPAGPTQGQPVLAGGGVRNAALRAALAHRAPTLTTTDEAGIPSGYREAACFAVLGALCQDRVPITLPQVTGVPRAPLSGTWTNS